MNADFRQAVLAAAVRPDVVEAVHALYRDVQSQINVRRPICAASGRCCRFDEFEHRLYVTTIELAAFLKDLDEQPAQLARFYNLAHHDPGGCLFQQLKLCSVHAIRPFGCRIFFCDETAAEWQHEQYERFHSGLKSLHVEMGVPYYYVEWRQALRILARIPE